MASSTDAKVLMVGPDRSLKGGIVSVVNGYFEAGLSDRCGRLDYHGTGVGVNLLAKSIAFAKSLSSYKNTLDPFDIVHLHMGPRGSYQRKKIMARIAENKGKKVILHEHSGEFARDFESGNNVLRSDIRQTFNSADLVIVLSEEWRDYFAENVCDSSKLVVLHNGVSVPQTPCTPCSHQTVLFLGRLGTRKSPDVLLRASREALMEYPGMRLVFGGDGDLNFYENLAEKLGIADRCDFIGWVSGDDKERLFSEAGVYCLPSKHEGMPMSVLEAMAHGIPVITTPVGGIPHLISDGVDGCLMNVDDESRLSDLLLEFERSPQRRAEIGYAGRDKIQAGFDINDILNQLVTFYNELFMA